MLNLPILLVLVRQREKSQKYDDLSSFNWYLNHSDLCSTHGAMNFLKWELFLAHPVETWFIGNRVNVLCMFHVLDVTLDYALILIPSK